MNTTSNQYSKGELLGLRKEHIKECIQKYHDDPIGNAMYGYHILRAVKDNLVTIKE